MNQMKKIKLNNLNRSDLTEREMVSLQGGNYCAWDSDNKKANESAGVCSCYCGGSSDTYYNGAGLNTQASIYKSGN